LDLGFLLVLKGFYFSQVSAIVRSLVLFGIGKQNLITFFGGHYNIKRLCVRFTSS
jgi:hypothetical protein